MQIEFFRENSNLFPEVARSRCRDLFVSKYYAFATVFIDVLSSRTRGATATTLAPTSITAKAGRALSVLLLIRFLGKGSKDYIYM